jgi:site-specific DNA recombinase
MIELCEAKAATIALVRGTDLDMSTPSGILVADVMGATARHEIKQKSDRQKRAQQQAADQGRPSGGRRPFGYGVPTGETRKARGKERPVFDVCQVVEDEAKYIREAYSDILTAASLKGIAKRWNEAGLTTTAGNPWRHDNVRSLLMNARNAGLRTYRGAIVGDAVWPALIDRDTFDAALTLLSMPERRTTASTARKYLLPAIALCWKCGSDVATGHTQRGQRVYVCRAKKCISRAAEPVDELIEAVVVARLSRPDAVDLLSASDAPDLQGHKAKANKIRQRIDDLATGLEEGILTLPAVRQSSERLKAELSIVEAAISTATHADVLTPLVTAPDVSEVWAGLDLQQKRLVIDALMTITLLAPKRGRQQFDPDTVQIEWRQS